MVPRGGRPTPPGSQMGSVLAGSLILSSRGRLGMFPCIDLAGTDLKHYIWVKGLMDQEGGELGLFQILKHNKTTLTYAMLVRHQFTNRITKLPTQAMRDITRSKA